MPTYPFTLTMLSPVHIGTGEEIDPSEYVVTAEKAGDDAQYVVDVLDLPAFLGSLTPAARREFDDAVAKNALFYLRRFVADRCDRRRFRRYWCATGREFYEHYRKGLTSDASQLVVNTMTRTGLDGRPYVPGSSLKGSLRTAVVSTLALEAARDPQIADDLDGIARDDHRHREFEPTVLGYRNARGRAEIR
ncbi:MAG TPA: type III-A CRISPR-associated RAMP protein Csm5, partial [Methanoregulaceae archaeon]|nr:type III-A CRISPR-associated RAMP protein Csm5 [Methanoregulaceae archaeon]